MNRIRVLVLVVFLSVFLVATGAVDLDWQLVQYRYSEWHRTVDFWEFFPGFRLPWYSAYMLSLGRLIAGCILLGFVAGALWVGYGKIES